MTGREDPGFFAANRTKAGVAGNGASEAPRLTPLGRTVVFLSRASNLDPLDTDTTADLYAKNLRTGTLSLVSRGRNGAKANAATSGNHRISPDGWLVAYVTAASNVDRRDTDRNDDCYLNGVNAPGVPTLIHVNASGVKGDGACASPSFGPDGRTVVFSSTARFDARDRDGFYDIYAVTLGDSTKSAIAGDRLLSGPGNDLVFAGPGDDAITPAGGDDVVDGGSGRDVVRYGGSFTDFEVKPLGNGWYTVQDSLAVGEGLDLLHDVETLDFDGLLIDPSVFTATTLTTTLGTEIDFGTPVPLAVDVVGSATGTVKLYDNGRLVRNLDLVNGKASFTADNLALGKHSFVARFQPTATRDGSRAALDVAVKTPVELTVELPAGPYAAGSTVQARVSASASLAPSMTVEGSVNLRVFNRTNRQGVTYRSVDLTNGATTVEVPFNQGEGAYRLTFTYDNVSANGNQDFDAFYSETQSRSVDVGP